MTCSKCENRENNYNSENRIFKFIFQNQGRDNPHPERDEKEAEK